MCRCSHISAWYWRRAFICRHRSSPGSRAWHDCWARGSANGFCAALKEKGRPVEGHRPWPRVIVDEETWRQGIVGVAAREATLVGLWSDGGTVHLGLMQEPAGELLVVSLPCTAQRFPSVALSIPPRCAWSAQSAIFMGWSPRVVPTSGVGSTTAAGVYATRREPGSGGDQRRYLHISSIGRPADAPDCSWARPCRHHRARTLSLHGQWRGGRAARGETRLRS